jgi:hypothetical protein
MTTYESTFITFVVPGSLEFEGQRLEAFLDSPEAVLEDDIIALEVSTSVTLRLSRQILMTGGDTCKIFIFRSVNL